MKRLSLGLVAFSMPFVIALCVPQLRTLMRVQMLGSVSMLPPQVPWSEQFENRETFVASRLLPSHPDDVRVQAMAAQEDGYRRVVEDDSDDGSSSSVDEPLVGPTDEEWKQINESNAERNRRVGAEYDRLIAQHPREAWLIAKRLRLTTSWLSDNRLAGELDETQNPPRKPTRERDDKPQFFTASDLQSAIATARQGQALEPDNAYFDWMLALFLMQGERDKDAWQTLHQASLKARYDEHLREESHAMIGVKELVRPRLLEEKIGVASALVFPHLSRFRHLARMVSWQALKLERAGQADEALNLRADLARASSLMMRGNNTLIAALVGSAMQSIAWQRRTGKRIPQDQLRAMGLDPDSGGYNILYARNFAAYARSRKRPDVAAETLKLSAQTISFQGSQRQARDSDNGSISYGLTRPLLSRVRSAWWLGFALLAQMALLAASWFVVSLVLMRRRVPVEFQAAPRVPLHPVHPVASRELLWSVVPCAVATLLLGTLAMRRGIGIDLLMEMMPTPSRTDFVSGPVFLAACVLAPLAIGALICGLATWLRMKGALESSGERLPSVMGRERLGRERSSRYDGLTARHQGGEMGGLLWTLATLGVASLSIGGLMTGIGALILQPAGFQIPLPWPGASLAAADLAPASLIMGTLASGLWLCGWIIKARWLTPLALRRLSLHGLVWFRSTLAAFLIVSSWAYLGALCLSVAPRQQADAAFNTFLERGEIGMLLLPSKSINIE